MPRSLCVGTIIMKANKLQHLPANTTGRDFVIGDIHGCFDEFQALLKGIEFAPSIDRMISVGDLIDRGPASMECADLVYLPWFYAVRGNHEQMMIDTILNHDMNAKDTWLYNGGMWSVSRPVYELKDAATRLDELPLIIAVGTGKTRYNVVHAELKHAHRYSQIIYAPGEAESLVTDQMIDTWGFSTADEDGMIWGRSIINGHEQGGGYGKTQSQDPDNLSITFVGHTPGREVKRAEQQIYLDTSAVYHHTSKHAKDFPALTVACPTDGNIYTYNMAWKTLRSFPISSVVKA